MCFDEDRNKLSSHKCTVYSDHRNTETVVSRCKLINPLTTDNYSCHQNSTACYQLAQFVLKIGSVLAERVGQGEVGGRYCEGDSALRLLQLAVEKPWSVPSGPFVGFAQTGVETPPFTL